MIPQLDGAAQMASKLAQEKFAISSYSLRDYFDEHL